MLLLCLSTMASLLLFTLAILLEFPTNKAHVDIQSLDMMFQSEMNEITMDTELLFYLLGVSRAQIFNGSRESKDFYRDLQIEQTLDTSKGNWTDVVTELNEGIRFVLYSAFQDIVIINNGSKFRSIYDGRTVSRVPIDTKTDYAKADTRSELFWQQISQTVDADLCLCRCEADLAKSLRRKREADGDIVAMQQTGFSEEKYGDLRKRNITVVQLEKILSRLVKASAAFKKKVLRTFMNARSNPHIQQELKRLLKRARTREDNIEGDCMSVLKTQLQRFHQRLSICVKKSDLQNKEIPRKALNSEVENFPESCFDVLGNGFNESGSYILKPRGWLRLVKVVCDMTTQGGGWVVFQRRHDGTVDFDRTFKEYAIGFGQLSGEFWLGLDIINAMSQPKEEMNQVLRIDMEDYFGNKYFAEYSFFYVSRTYELRAWHFSGNIYESLKNMHDGMYFFTKDHDNQLNCGKKYKAGWWYSNLYDHCVTAHLNGPYGQWQPIGIDWLSWDGKNVTRMRKVEMKFRPHFANVN